MILTLTCNLLAERTLTFPAWSPGRTQRATAESFQVGGKGINVAKMLARLQTPNTALCFTGGAPGAECEAWLRARSFSFHAFATTTPTRSGTIVRDASSSRRETTFLGPDAPPDAAAISACAAYLDAQPPGRVLALCGSIPGWSDGAFEPLRQSLGRWAQRGTLVVDTYGPPLHWFAAQRQPALFKINLDEFRTLAAAGDIHDLLNAAPETWPGTQWIVSDGPNAVWLVEKPREATVLTPPLVEEVSATGSGDVMLACILHARFTRGLPLRDAVAFALPYAAANAAHPGIAEFPDPPPGIA